RGIRQGRGRQTDEVRPYAGTDLQVGRGPHVSALMKAIRQNDVPAVRTLIAQGVNVSELDDNDDAPLVMAAYEGRSEIVRLLLKDRAICTHNVRTKYVQLTR